MRDLGQRDLNHATDSAKTLIEKVQNYMVYARENPTKAREEITDIVRKNFLKAYERVEASKAEVAVFIGLVALAVYGLHMSISRAYEIAETPTNKGAFEVMIGAYLTALAVGGMAAAPKLFEHFRRSPTYNNYQPQG